MPKELCNRCSGFGCPDCRATGFQIAAGSPDCRFCGGNAWIADNTGPPDNPTYFCGACKAVRYFHPKKAKYVQDRSAGPVKAATATTVNGAAAQTVVSSVTQPQQATFTPPVTQHSLYPFPCVCSSAQWTLKARRTRQNPTGTVKIELDWVCSNCGNRTTVVQNP